MEYQGINVIEISGESCANCYSLMPILHRLVSQYEDVKLVHIEASKETEDKIKELDVDRVPTVIVVKDDKEIARVRGFQPEEILTIWLEAKIASAK